MQDSEDKENYRWRTNRVQENTENNSIGSGESVPFVCVVFLSDKGLCDGSIPCPEESYRLWCVTVWSRNLKNEAALARVGLLCQRKKNTLNISYNIIMGHIST